MRILDRAHATVVGLFRYGSRGNTVAPYEARLLQAGWSDEDVSLHRAGWAEGDIRRRRRRLDLLRLREKQSR